VKHPPELETASASVSDAERALDTRDAQRFALRVGLSIALGPCASQARSASAQAGSFARRGAAQVALSRRFGGRP
jgi:hypothetical protein